MAEMGYGCVFGDCQTQPNHMITTINPPSTISTCDEHYAPALIPLLAAELGADPGDFYTMVEKYLAREAKKAEKALADAQAAEAAQGSQGLAAEAQVDDTGLDEGQDDDRAEAFARAADEAGTP